MKKDINKEYIEINNRLAYIDSKLYKLETDINIINMSITRLFDLFVRLERIIKDNAAKDD